MIWDQMESAAQAQTIESEKRVLQKMSEPVSSLQWVPDMHHALFNGAPEDALSYGWPEWERARDRIGQAGSSGVLASHKQPNSRPPRRVVLTDATR